MFQKHKLKFLILTVILTLPVLFYRWTDYFLHLLGHQTYVWLYAKDIDNFDKSKFSTKEQEAFLQIEAAKIFGKKNFDLPKSKSYNRFVDLKRDYLGFNITVTPEFSLEPVAFGFPIVGSFSYLGFFDKEKALAWQSYYQKRNHDVYLSEIAAYSTLGFLDDPIFSTYLDFSFAYLVDLILHEMTHEKLFFKSDILLSETLAVYVAEKAALLFFKEEKKKHIDKTRKQNIAQEYNIFYDTIEKYQKQLKELYLQTIPMDKKREQKEKIFARLKKSLEQLDQQFVYVTWQKSLLKRTLNNATLVQIKRYSPRSIDVFDDLLFEVCQNNFSCFFNHLKTLKKHRTKKLHDVLLKDNNTWQDVKILLDKY